MTVVKKQSRIALRLPTDELDTYLAFCRRCGDITVSDYVRIGCVVFMSAINGLENSAFNSIGKRRAHQRIRDYQSIKIANMAVRGLLSRRNLVYVDSCESRGKQYYVWCAIEGTCIQYGVHDANNRPFFESIGFGGSTNESVDGAYEAIGFFDWCFENGIGHTYRFGEGYL